MRRVTKTQKWAYGWHWLKDIGLDYGDGRKPTRGERMEARHNGRRLVKMPRWCGPGMHAAPTLSDAKRYSRYGQTLTFVLVEDARFFAGKDKFVGRTRTILWECRVPDHVRLRGTAEDIQRYIEKAGFKRASATGYARRLRAGWK